MLKPEVTVVVHPYQGEWRWGVNVGGQSPGDLDHCVQAGLCPTEPEASFRGEEVGAAVAKGVRMLGVPARYSYLRLGYDPLPDDTDQRPLGVWRGEDDKPDTTEGG